MKATQRRQTIIEILGKTSQAISASQLAHQLGVSRQVIVGDVALLRANNQDIFSTPRGYLLANNLMSHDYKGKLVCCHSLEETQDELKLIVENGGRILDVEIEHPVYGMLTAALNISTIEDVLNFAEKMDSSSATLLSSLTQGIHLHTIACPSKDIFDTIKEALDNRGYLMKEE